MEIVKYKLKQLCDLQNGYAFKSKDYIDSSETLCCRMSNIRPNASFNILYKPKYLPDSFIKKYKSFLLKEGDLIIAMTDMAGDPKILGVPTIVKTNGYNLLLNQRVGKLFDFDYSKIYVPLLKRILADDKYKNYYKKFAGGGVQLNISKDKILNIELSIPKSIDNQKRIAQVLSNCESLIEKRKESIALLDELLKSTFLEMFAKRDREEVSLGEEIDIQNGLVNPNELPYSEMFHVGGRNIESNTGKISNLIKAKDENLISGKYLFEEGYLLYSKIRPNLNKVAVMDFTGICSADVYPIKPKKTNRINLHFLRYELMSQKFVTYAVNNSGRANIPKINRKTLNAYKLKLPSIEKQNKFAEIVKKTEVIRNHFYTHLQELENLYGTISQKAFKGELDFGKVKISGSSNAASTTSGISDSVIDIKTTVADSLEPPKEEEKRPKFSKKELEGLKAKSKEKRDITNITYLDFIGIPTDLQMKNYADDYSIETDFVGDKLFAQFYLKDNFRNEKFVLGDIEGKFNSYFIPKGQDFNYESWKEFIFNFIESKPPIVEQFFDETDNTVKLKLTDEAFKA